MMMPALHYLATVYSRHPNGIEQAFMEAAALVARLLRRGILSYSPIAHTHPVATHGGIDPLDHSIWLPFDEAMMDRCDALLVANMPGWRESKGIAFETNWFENAGKPVLDLNVADLSMTARP